MRSLPLCFTSTQRPVLLLHIGRRMLKTIFCSYLEGINLGLRKLSRLDFTCEEVVDFGEGSILGLWQPEECPHKGKE
jgi:hypothetical protein